MTPEEKVKLSAPLLRELVRALHGAQVTWPAPRSTESLHKLRCYEEALEAAKLVTGEV